ncbi:MAG: D-aminoacyl-tRNA deacylase [Succinivibrio sp.]
MRTLIQRVTQASVSSGGRVIGSIGAGILLFAGFEKGDTPELARRSMEKAVLMRIFEDEAGKLNLSVKDRGGQAMLISQFTLASDCAHGHRPGFERGMRSEEARPLYDLALSHLESLLPGRVQSGAFGEDMQVSLVNDGPCTFMLDLPPAPFAQARPLH